MWYALQEQDEDEAAGVKVLEVADPAKQVRRNHGNRLASLAILMCLKNCLSVCVFVWYVI